MSEMNKQQKGEYAHLRFQARCVEKGIIVSKPQVETRYDFILDDHGVLKRVQVKFCDSASSGSEGAYQLNLRMAGKGYKKNCYTAEEVDLIIVWLHSSGMLICLLPEHFAGKSSLCLRVNAPKNNQHKGVLMAKDFEW